MNLLAFGLGNLGGPDLFVILLIILVLFGAKKLPELARGLGQGVNEFKKAREDFERELHHSGSQAPLPDAESSANPSQRTPPPRVQPESRGPS